MTEAHDTGRGRHTAGEWEISHEPPRWIIQARGPIGCKAVAYMVGDYIECAANARLIAATPGLLETARASLEAIEAIIADKPMMAAKLCGSTTLGNHRAELASVIAKAEGRTP